jgi:N-acetylhexosamine 1-kinase
MKYVITEEEVNLFVDSCILMTLELAIRFLDDHVAGNQYFGVPYDGKNLERARVQIALVKAMEEKRSELDTIVLDVWNKVK